MAKRRRTIRPSSKGGPAQRKAAKVMKEPLSKFTAKTKRGKIAQRFAVAQSMARRVASGRRKRRSR